jgi:hypothetical protein
MTAPSTAQELLDNRFEEIDEAIRLEDDQRQSRGTSAPHNKGNVLPKLLRYVGSTVLIASALAFMAQNWSSGDDILRYFYFLGFTLVLSGAGVLCGLRIRDDKGARTFLGLAAAIVPAHFTVLGALLYSQFPWLSGFSNYPSYALITAPDGLAAVVTTGVAVATLIPITWMAFMAFTRAEAPRLSKAYLLANCALLVPTRHPDLIAVMGLAMLAALLVFDRRTLHPSSFMRTREGYFVRVMLVSPLLVLIGRSLNLYEVSSLFVAGAFAMLASLLFEIVPAALKNRRLQVWSQRLSVPAAAAAWAVMTDTICSSFGADAYLPIFCLPMSALLVLMSVRTLDSGSGFRAMAALLGTGGAAANLVIFPGVGASFICLLVAIVTSAYGFSVSQKSVFFAGLASGVFALLYHLRFAIELYDASPWGSLAALGTATVLAASLLERHHEVLAARSKAFCKKIDTWSF